MKKIFSFFLMSTVIQTTYCQITTDKKDTIPKNCLLLYGVKRIPAANFKSYTCYQTDTINNFNIVQSTVYFSGANFQQVVMATLNGSSLEPLRYLLSRCGPGSVIIFDNVRVSTPHDGIRTIDGQSFVLY